MARLFGKISPMNDVKGLNLPKWPFWLGNLLLLGFAWFVVWKSPHPISITTVIFCVSLCAVGAILGCVPFILEYRAFLKIVEVNALGTAVEQIQNLEKFSTQISDATNRWAAVQESTGGQAEKTAASAKEIADRMSNEVREFSDFMEKINDSEKATLRLEIEKLRRGEAEWLQTLVRILDHIFALHNAAARAGQPKVAEQISHFQSACRGVIRRVGLAAFAAEKNEPFNPERHQVADGAKPAADSVVGETVGPGYTFQGKLLRPALVKLRDKNAAPEAGETEQKPAELSLEQPD